MRLLATLEDPRVIRQIFPPLGCRARTRGISPTDKSARRLLTKWLPVEMTATDLLRSAGIAMVAFALLGTAATLWENPLFVRMTPTRTASFSGALGFLGIACPVCNKILAMILGSSLLLNYFEPIRVYVALAGAFSMLVALWWKLSSVKTRLVESRG